MKKFYLSGFILVLALVSSSGEALAHHKGRVLAESTPSGEINFPAITSGPGFILPDSPLFFLDQIFQTVRLTMALDPQTKARVRAQIAGERLAELRVMLTRQSPRGIDIALTHLTDEVDLASQNLSEASSRGQNVAILARELNSTIKLQREILARLEDQAGGDLRLRLKAARAAIKEAKTEVEDELTEDELEIEIEDELEDEIEDEVEEASQSARKVERLLDKLNEEASRSAQKALKRREEALRKAIETQNKELERQEEKLKKDEENKREDLRKTREKAAEKARKATREAQKAAEELKELQKKVDEVRKVPVGSNRID